MKCATHGSTHGGGGRRPRRPDLLLQGLSRCGGGSMLTVTVRVLLARDSGAARAVN